MKLEEYQNKSQDGLTPDLTPSDAFKLSFDCKYHLPHNYNDFFGRSIDKGFGIATLPYIPADVNPCSNCTFYQSYILGNKTYIGDSPCEWCSKSPSKLTVTYADSIQANTDNSASTGIGRNHKTILNESFTGNIDD